MYSDSGVPDAGPGFLALPGVAVGGTPTSVVRPHDVPIPDCPVPGSDGYPLLRRLIHFLLYTGFILAVTNGGCRWIMPQRNGDAGDGNVQGGWGWFCPENPVLKVSPQG